VKIKVYRGPKHTTTKLTPLQREQIEQEWYDKFVRNVAEGGGLWQWTTVQLCFALAALAAFVVGFWLGWVMDGGAK